MSLVAGARMVRADDGMKGTVELVAMPGFEQYEELRIVYTDRGEKRIAGKREVWTPEVTPPKKLRVEEILYVAYAADRALRSIDRNEPDKWWRRDTIPDQIHDLSLLNLIIDHLEKRG